MAVIAEQISRHNPKLVSVATEKAARELCSTIHRQRQAEPIEILFGLEGMERVATHPDADTVVSAAVGVVGLPATYKAIEHGKNVALANKEVLVAAGEVVMTAVARHGVALLPVDSEHNAVHQCLRAGDHGEVSGLSLRHPAAHFAPRLYLSSRVTPEQALAHPNWKMGRRITIDSATS